MGLILSRTFVDAALGGLVFVITGVTPVVAGGFGCAGAAKECYEKVAVPDTYAVVSREVVIQPARMEAVREPAVVMKRVERVEVAPGRWQRETIPAHHGSVVRSVLVRPASVSYSISNCP
jgi:hypothetical protein